MLPAPLQVQEAINAEGTALQQQLPASRALMYSYASSNPRWLLTPPQPKRTQYERQHPWTVGTPRPKVGQAALDGVLVAPMPGRLADKASDAAALPQRQGCKGAPGSSLPAHSGFAREASQRLTGADRAQLRTDGGVSTDAQVGGQLPVASASGLRLRAVTALHRGSAGTGGAVMAPDGGTEAAPQVEVAGRVTAAVSAGSRGPQAPLSSTSAHESAVTAAEAASRHSRRLGDKKAAARAAARAAAAAERAAGSDLAGDRQDRRQRAAALARGRQARAARRERAAQGPGTEHSPVATAAGGAARRGPAAAAPRAAAKAATGATSQRHGRRKAAAVPGAHDGAHCARCTGRRAAAPATGTARGGFLTDGAPAGRSGAAVNAQSGGSDATGAAQRVATSRTVKPGHGGGAGHAAAATSTQAAVRRTKGTSAGAAQTPPRLGKGARVCKAPEVYTPMPTRLVVAGTWQGATGKHKAAAADSDGPSKRRRRAGRVQEKRGVALTDEWTGCPCSDYVPVVMKADSKTADLRNNLHAAWRVGQTQKYDKMALQQAELQAAQRRGPVTARQQQMQEKAAARRSDSLRGLSKDYALLDALKQVANSCKGVRECVKVCQYADRAQPLTCNQDDEVDADEINCGLCDVRESTDDNDIVCCDGPCNSAYHVKCQRPHVTQEELDAVGEGRWLCRACSAKAEVIALLNEEYGFEYMEDVDWEDVLRGDMQDWHTKAEARPTTDRTPLATADNSSQDSDGDSAMEEAFAGGCPAAAEVNDEPWGPGASEGDSTSDDESMSGADAASEPDSADLDDAPADMQMG